jgi:hypothetical protein
MLTRGLELARLEVNRGRSDRETEDEHERREQTELRGEERGGRWQLVIHVGRVPCLEQRDERRGESRTPERERYATSYPGKHEGLYLTLAGEIRAIPAGAARGRLSEAARERRERAGGAQPRASGWALS